MPSVSTPSYPAVILPVTLLPPLSERTPETVMRQISIWSHWYEIQRIAFKEYGMESEKFGALLPEYQRFLGLIMLGHASLGMFSFEIDKIWHSHILASHLWARFCMEYHGRMINHVPQVSLPDESKVAICTTCRSCTNCSGGGQGGGGGGDDGGKGDKGISGSRETAQEFATAYFQAFGMQPPSCWDLSEPEGCATY